MLFRSIALLLPALAFTAARPQPLGVSVQIGAGVSIGGGDPNDGGDYGSTGNQYFLTATNVAPDNSTATLNVGGNGTIAALGTFDAVSGVRWTQDLLEVGYSAKVGASNTLGGGYTINADGISVGAGIGVNGTGTSFSLTVHNNGSIVASVFGGNLNCSVDGSKATCTN
ncbi:hypothetical protein OC835_000730 [Tilletia horrida]|nr:hypothetical protein OC835_000730 [Tilletia horrida]